VDVTNDEHRMLQDSLDSILSETADPAEIWQQLAGLGMLGLTLPEHAGGAELGMPELLLLSYAMGRAGLTTPHVGAEILAMPLLARFSDLPSVAPLLGRLVDGSRIVTLSLEARAPVMADRNSESGFRMNGEVTLVPAGASADLIVLMATLDCAPALFLLDLGTPGVLRIPYLPVTPGGGADIRLTDVTLPEGALLAHGDEAAALIAEAQARGQLATCGEMLGGMEVLLELTVDYLRTRHQFGQPLAAFQVLQHAAVDMYVELETARAMLDYGRRMFGADPMRRSLALDAVKLKMNEAAKVIGESAVQLHGGIGMTEESLTGRQFARLTAGRLAFGDSRSCMNRLLTGDESIALS